MEWRILVKNEKVIILTVGNLKKKPKKKDIINLSAY